jgi:streptogramin lyase
MYRRHLPLAAFAALGSLGIAQETYWVASGANALEIATCGGVVRTAAIGASARSVHVAPDGKIWCVTSPIRILNADGSAFGMAAFSLGSPFQLAFDRNGHAWVSGGTGVEEYDANGVSQGTVPLTATAPLGICVDADGNKWIAHRAGPPGSVSRIDGTTRAVSNHPMAVGSLILPTRVMADFRGPGASSHIWVVGDNRGAGELIELDAAGTVLNTYVINAGGNLGSLAADIDPTSLRVRNVYVGDFRNGNIHQVDPATGLVTNLWSAPPNVLGLNFDGFGKLWASVREVSTATPPTPPQLVRLEASTGAHEVDYVAPSTLASPMSTRWEHVTVVDPLGDLDGDGAGNLGEVLSGSSPFDACSKPTTSLRVDGSTRLGGTVTLSAAATAGNTTGVVFALGTMTPGFGLPGVGCSFRLDFATLFPVTLSIPANGSRSLTIPMDPTLPGVTLRMQGLTLPALPAFTNVNCILFH